MPNPTNDWLAALESALAPRHEQSAFRSRRSLTILDSTHVDMDGRRLINFAANDYLGFTHHPELIQTQQQAVARLGVGSGAAGLITGHTAAHTSAESTIARWKGTEAAVLLSSGFTANTTAVATLAALAPPGRVRFLIDKLSHASLLDAVQNTGCFRVFPHNHLPKLQRLLEEADPGQLQVVVTESIFSMDGDRADLAGIIALKRRFPFMLLLDEAHASGVYGTDGAGLAREMGFSADVDISVVTFSKALGTVGGAVCCSNLFRDALLNFGRPYIFSTSVPPGQAVVIERSVQLLQEEPQHQARVRHLAARVRAVAAECFKDRVPPGDSPIIPLIVGSAAAALSAAKILEQQGLLTVAVRPPTVAPGKARLRITLSSEHTDAEIDQLINAIRGIKPESV